MARGCCRYQLSAEAATATEASAEAAPSEEAPVSGANQGAATSLPKPARRRAAPTQPLKPHRRPAASQKPHRRPAASPTEAIEDRVLIIPGLGVVVKSAAKPALKLPRSQANTEAASVDLELACCKSEFMSRTAITCKLAWNLPSRLSYLVASQNLCPGPP